MHLLPEKLVSDLTALLKKESEKRAETAEEMITVAKLMNRGVAPTIGSGGRLHAPHSGYRWLGCDYQAGEFLTEEFEGREALGNEGYRHAPGRSRKVENVPSAAFAELSQKLENVAEVNVTAGREWLNDSEEYTCNMYVETPSRAAFDLIDDFFAALAKAQEQRERAQIADAPSGRVTIQGTILSAGYRQSGRYVSAKMLVKTREGYKVWTSVPKSLAGSVKHVRALEGQPTSLKITLTPSTDDPKFARGARPIVTQL